MFNFYRKLIARQLRLSSMRLFCLAVAVSCAVTFSITLLGDRLEQLFNQQAKEVIAADLALQSTTELSQEQKNIISEYSLRTAKTLSFQTMSNAGEEFLLSSVKAVSNEYPLLGQLQVADQLYGETISTQDVPQPGNVWVEDRVLNSFGRLLKVFLPNACLVR